VTDFINLSGQNIAALINEAAIRNLDRWKIVAEIVNGDTVTISNMLSMKFTNGKVEKLENNDNNYLFSINIASKIMQAGKPFRFNLVDNGDETVMSLNLPSEFDSSPHV